MYEEILKSFSEIISGKLGKHYEKMLEKLWKSMGNTSPKLKKKKILMEIVKFPRKFSEELTKNCTETLNNFREKCGGTRKKILKYLGRSWKSILAKLPRVKSRERRKATPHFRVPMVGLDTCSLMEKWWFLSFIPYFLQKYFI